MVTEMMENLFQRESFENISEKQSDLVFLQNAVLQPDPLFETFTLSLYPLWAMLWSTDAAAHRSKILDFHVAGTNPLIALAIKIMAFSQRCNYCMGWKPWRWMIHGKT